MSIYRHHPGEENPYAKIYLTLELASVVSLFIVRTSVILVAEDGLPSHSLQIGNNELAVHGIGKVRASESKDKPTRHDHRHYIG